MDDFDERRKKIKNQYGLQNVKIGDVFKIISCNRYGDLFRVTAEQMTASSYSLIVTRCGTNDRYEISKYPAVQSLNLNLATLGQNVVWIDKDNILSEIKEYVGLGHVSVGDVYKVVDKDNLYYNHKFRITQEVLSNDYDYFVDSVGLGTNFHLTVDALYLKNKAVWIEKTHWENDEDDEDEDQGEDDSSLIITPAENKGYDTMNIKTEESTMTKVTNKAVEAANKVVVQSKQDVKDASWRVVTEQAVELICEQAIKLADKHCSFAASACAPILETTVGKAGLAWAVGTAILVSNHKNNNLQRLGTELRIYGHAKVLTEVFSKFVKPMLGDLVNLVESLPELVVGEQE